MLYDRFDLILLQIVLLCCFGGADTGRTPFGTSFRTRLAPRMKHLVHVGEPFAYRSLCIARECIVRDNRYTSTGKSVKSSMVVTISESRRFYTPAHLRRPALPHRQMWLALPSS